MNSTIVLKILNTKQKQKQKQKNPKQIDKKEKKTTTIGRSSVKTCAPNR